MAIDRNHQEGFEQSGNPWGSLIKTAAGLAPLGFGAYKMMGEIKSNAALNPAVPLGVGQSSGGNIPAIGAGIGEILGQGIRDNRESDLARLKKLTDDVMSDDSFQRVFQSLSEQNALIQSLLETMDDPGNQLGTSVLMGDREKLMRLMRDETDPDKLKETIQSIVRAVNDHSPEHVRLRMEKNFREYKKVGAALIPPTSPMKAKPLNTVDPSNLIGKARTRYDELVKNLGQGGAGRVNIVKTIWGGEEQLYARVYSGGAGKSSFLDVLPLQTSAGTTGVHAIFTNENLTTGYAAPRKFIEARQAAIELASATNASVTSVLNAASIDVEDFFLREFTSRINTSSPKDKIFLTKGGAQGFRSWKTQFMNVLPRMSYSIKNGFANEHIYKTQGHEMNIATVVGLENMNRKDQEALMLRLGTTPGFESRAPGYQFLTKGIGDQPIGRIGLYEGSAIQNLRTVGGATRAQFPVESRIEQVWGRDQLFVTNRTRSMGRGGTLTAGPTTVAAGSVVNQVGRNIEWAEALTGATNKAVLLDVKGDIWEALSGTGAAYTTGREKVRSFTTKPILDPGEKGYMASKLFMDEIVANAREGEMIRLSRAQIDKYGGFLGFGPQGAQHLRMDPRMDAMYVAYNITEAHGKRQINIMSMVERDMEVWKGFSMLHKGTVESKTPKAFRRMIHKDMGVSRQLIKNLRLRTRDIVVAPADMLKKGAGFLDLQMRSGYGLVAGAQNWESHLQGVLSNPKMTLGLPEHQLGRTTSAIIEALAASKATDEEAGMVLAGIYHNDRFLKDTNKAMQISQEAIKKAIGLAFGNRAAGVLSVAEKGVALGATSFTQGMGPGDYALGRGSVEPRFITNLQHRLKNMGFSVNESANIIAQVYKQKIGFAGGMKSATGLMRMTESMTGGAGLLEGIARESLKTFNLKDLSKLSSEGLSELITSSPEGFILDLTSGADTVATRAIASHAKDVFGQGQLFIPGRDVVDAMKDTFIKTARDLSGNNRDIIVHGEYTRIMEDFFTGLHSATSRSLQANEFTRDVMETFKSRATDLATRSIMGVARGKIRGMQSMYARPYDMNLGKSFSNESNLKRARSLMQRTKGQAAFMDTTGFLSQLNDFMGNGTNPNAVRDAARKAERFFIGMEEAFRTKNMGKAKGIMQIATRHPELGLGNVTPIQIFRHLDEVGTVTDMDRNIFGMLGKKYSVSNWADVARLSSDKNNNQRLGFFTDLVNNLNTLAPEGGGSIFLPRHMNKVLVDGMKDQILSVDFGVSGAAIGDFDGDQWMSMMLNHDTGRQILSTLKTGKSDDWLKADALYKVKSEIFAEEAKEGLKKHNADKGIEFFDSAERVRESLMKEQAAKSAVGSLDTRLNKLRMAVLDLKMSGKAERASVDQAMALLKIVQEHAVIKGKKLPVYLPFAEMLTGSIDRAFSSGDMGDFFNVMENQIFPGSKLFQDGITIKEVTDSPFAWQRSITNEHVSLKPTMALIKQAVETARVTGIADMPTANWMNRYLGETPEEAAHYMALLNAGQTLESSMLRGTKPMTGKEIAASTEVGFRRMARSLGTVDKKLLGIGAAAVAGSFMLAAAIGAQGYAPEPMIMPGEVVDPAIRESIGRGNALSPDNFRQNSDQYAMMNRPFTTPTTYVQAPNSYQVRGQIPSMRGLGMANDYLGTLGSGTRGSIRVNDTRLPITSSYLDRLTGEY